MTTINCENSSCTYNDNGICQAMAIDLSYDCWTYEDITEGPEYQEEFWIRSQYEKDGPIVREQRHGKKVELCGLTFYTTDDIRTEKDKTQSRMTEATTGVACGCYARIEERLDIIKKGMETIKTPLMELPVYERVSG